MADSDSAPDGADEYIGSDKVPEQVSALWRTVARKIEAEARGDIVNGTDFEREHRARYLLRMARLAEAAWWQSTGDGSTFDFKPEPVDIERNFVDRTRA